MALGTGTGGVQSDNGSPILIATTASALFLAATLILTLLMMRSRARHAQMQRLREMYYENLERTLGRDAAMGFVQPILFQVEVSPPLSESLLETGKSTELRAQKSEDWDTLMVSWSPMTIEFGPLSL